MTDQQIARINALARKARTEGLTEDERTEQKRLRDAYIAGFRSSLQAQLDHTLVLRPDGTTHRLRQRTKQS